MDDFVDRRKAPVIPKELVDAFGDREITQSFFEEWKRRLRRIMASDCFFAASRMISTSERLDRAASYVSQLFPSPEDHVAIREIGFEMLLQVGPNERRARRVGDAVDIDRNARIRRRNKCRSDEGVAVESRDHFALQLAGFVKGDFNLPDGAVAVKNSVESAAIREIEKRLVAGPQLDAHRDPSRWPGPVEGMKSSEKAARTSVE